MNYYGRLIRDFFQQLLEEAYHQKIIENKLAAEGKTAKKRAKRLKNKAKKRLRKSDAKNNLNVCENDEEVKGISESDSEDEHEINSESEQGKNSTILQGVCGEENNTSVNACSEECTNSCGRSSDIAT